MGWTAFRLIDLGMILYARSDRLHDRRSLSDMIVPTAANGLKLAVVVVAVAFQVYLVGSRETLTQLLAGLGLVGLAASLAAQDTLKNFFGTLLLIGEHPFRIGEHVAIQGMEGTGRERRVPLDPGPDVRGLAADDPQLGDGRRPDRQPRHAVLPPLPHGRLDGLRHAPRPDGRAARRAAGLRGGPSPGRQDKVEIHIADLGEQRGPAGAGLLPRRDLHRRDVLPRRVQPRDPPAGRAAGRRDRLPDPDDAGGGPAGTRDGRSPAKRRPRPDVRRTARPPLKANVRSSAGRDS